MRRGGRGGGLFHTAQKAQVSETMLVITPQLFIFELEMHLVVVLRLNTKSTIFPAKHGNCA